MSENVAETNSLRSNASEGQAQNDLVKAVDQLINNLGPKFSKVSAELFAKSEPDVDEMSARLDEMEAAIKAGNDGANDGV